MSKSPWGRQGGREAGCGARAVVNSRQGERERGHPDFDGSSIAGRDGDKMCVSAVRAGLDLEAVRTVGHWGTGALGTGQRERIGGGGAVGSGQWAVGSGQWAVGSGLWAVGSGQWAVGSGQWAVGSGQWAIGWDGELCALGRAAARRVRGECSVHNAHCTLHTAHYTLHRGV